MTRRKVIMIAAFSVIILAAVGLLLRPYFIRAAITRELTYIYGENLQVEGDEFYFSSWILEESGLRYNLKNQFPTGLPRQEIPSPSQYIDPNKEVRMSYTGKRRGPDLSDADIKLSVVGQVHAGDDTVTIQIEPDREGLFKAPDDWMLQKKLYGDWYQVNAYDGIDMTAVEISYPVYQYTDTISKKPNHCMEGVSYPYGYSITPGEYRIVCAIEQYYFAAEFTVVP